MDVDKPKATLYDFAFIDRERCKSLAAQLFSGLNISIQKSSSETTTHSTEGGVDYVVKGTHALTSGATSESSKTFDPHDLAFMDLIMGLRNGGYLRESPEAMNWHNGWYGRHCMMARQFRGDGHVFG